MKATYQTGSKNKKA